MTWAARAKAARQIQKERNAMRRIARFYDDSDKPAHTKINDWLRQNPDATLVDIKPVVSESRPLAVYVILDIPEHTNNSEKEKKTI